MQSSNRPAIPPVRVPTSGSRTLDSTTLLGNEGVVDILHNHERYTLRRTKQGKLILTK